jgi:hypothetical protein
MAQGGLVRMWRSVSFLLCSKKLTVGFVCDFVLYCTAWLLESGFFFSIVKLVFIPQQDLAKFGYRLDIKVKEFKNILIFWLPTGTCPQNMAIKKKSIIWPIRVIFMTNTLFMGQNHIFRAKKM